MSELAPFACNPAQSRGRRHQEPSATDRTDFQRDRDRIIHSSAFRRLVYKTQVFLNHEGDLFRTRLTHSLEVAQLARSIARNLALNEDLVEAIALAHDLGHTPFGHAGQDILNACMAPYGGFEHNLQSLRVVDRLEHRYPGFVGLNLCFETREGILKHCSRRNAELLALHDPTGVAERFASGTQPSLEAQLCNLADELAYCVHDIDDGVRSGLLTLEALDDEPTLAKIRLELNAEFKFEPLNDRVQLYTLMRRLMSQSAADLVRSTRARLHQSGVASVDEVRAAPQLLGFSAERAAALANIKRFLFAHLYRHPQVEAQRELAQGMLRDLFEHYLRDGVPEPAAEDPARACADYLAGMTDRFAIRAHYQLTGRRVFPVD